MDGDGPIRMFRGRALGCRRFSPLAVKPQASQIGNSQPGVPIHLSESQLLLEAHPIVTTYPHVVPSSPVNNSTNRGQYRFQRTLGEGGFGTVFQAIDSKTNETVAIKIFTIAKKLGSAKREVRILQFLNHSNIVAFKRSYSFKETRSGADGMAIVMEYCANGSLKDRLSVCSRALQVINVSTRSKWYEQLASALFHIHEKGIAHRDLKPANILLDNSDNVKIADVGIAKAAWECNGSSDSNKTTTFGHFLSTVIGSKPYMAPEVYGSNRYGLPCDVFSLGLVFWMIAEVPSSSPRVVPIYGCTFLGELLHNPTVRKCAATSLLSPPIKNSKRREIVLINKMLNWKPTDRPSIGEVCEKVEKLKQSVVKVQKKHFFDLLFKREEEKI